VDGEREPAFVGEPEQAVVAFTVPARLEPSERRDVVRRADVVVLDREPAVIRLEDS
jgi:hypothetical protein